MALGLIFAARPLVGSFAIDRVGEGDIGHMAVAAAISSNALGLMAGLVGAYVTGLRGAKWVSAVAMALAGMALGVTYLIRDPLHFVAAQFAAGVFGAWAVAAALSVEGGLRRAPWRGALVLLAAFAVATPLGSLLSEALGRRLAFIVIGAACVLAALLAFVGPAWQRRAGSLGLSKRGNLGAALSLATAASAVVAYFEIAAATDLMRENYSALAMLLALAGAASFVPAVFVSGRAAWLAPTGAAVAFVALGAAIAGASPSLVAPMLGLAGGFAVAACGAAIFSPVILTCALGGVLIAAASELVGIALGVPSLLLCAVVAALLAAAALVLAKR
ncbi:MAG: hypothetical protein AAFW98_00045 [Pseudomonadota bacterium]